MVFQYAHVLPIVGFFWFPVTFVITYIVAVCNKDVFPVLPYISDTGTWSPESCIFGQMLNMGALMTILLVYIRYRQVKCINDKTSANKKLQRWNYLSLFSGIAIGLGIMIVGNFQETNVLVVHLLGATLAFGIGNVYQWKQTWISFKLYPETGNKKVNYVRLACAAISMITNIGTFLCGAISFFQFTGDDITKWGPEDGGYPLHVASAFNEWILVMATCTFFLSFTGEFRSISIEEPKVFIAAPENKLATQNVPEA